MQMAKDFLRHAADCALGDFGEYRIAQFAKQSAGKAQYTISDEQHNRQDEYRLGRVKRIDDAF